MTIYQLITQIVTELLRCKHLGYTNFDTQCIWPVVMTPFSIIDIIHYET